MKVKIALDAADAIEKYKKFMEEVKKLDTDVAKARERNVFKQIEIEINARTDLDAAQKKEMIKRMQTLERVNRANRVRDDIKGKKGEVKDFLTEIADLVKNGELSKADARKALEKKRAEFASSKKDTSRLSELFTSDNFAGAQRAAFINAQAKVTAKDEAVKEQRITNAILGRIEKGIVTDNDVVAIIGTGAD
jgi:hypothetical protein